MLPNYDVKIDPRVDLSRIKWPPEKLLASEDGLLANRSYSDERGHTWREFMKAYKLERKIIRGVMAVAKSENDFEDMLNEEGEEISDGPDEGLCGFELGVASVTIAVSAFGCAPVTSCRCHPNKSHTKFPYVAFWTKRRKVGRIINASRELKKVGLRDYNLGGHVGLTAEARNVVDLMDFGMALYRADNHIRRRK